MSMGVRQLFSSGLLGIAEFECPPDDDAWRAVNVIESAVPLVVFPRVPVAIRHLGASAVLATPNLVMFYNPGQPYERGLRSPRGDDALLVQLHPPAVAALEPECTALRDGRLGAAHAPSARQAYLRQHLLARYLRSGAFDPLVVEETTVGVVGCVVGQPQPRGAPRSATQAAHRALAEEAKEVIAATPAATRSLHEIAAELGASPFHLARVFRRETGFSLHQFRTQLRLRLALQRLPDNSRSLTALALEHGFASHSHFTDTFTRAFGVAPSTVRRSAHVRRLLAAA